jgi:lactate permease
VPFGNLQQITAKQLSISPVHAAISNNSGGVMGKMIDAQSMVVVSMATNMEARAAFSGMYFFIAWR